MNHQELPWNHHGKPPWTTTNHHETTMVNHHKPLWTTTNHHEPPRLNHHKPPWLNHHEPPQLNHHKPLQLNHHDWTMTNHDIWTTTNHNKIASFAGGSRQQECTVLENLPGYWPWKQAEITVLGLILVSQVTCLVAGFEKSAEIAVLGLIRVSQENWKLFFVNLIKYFIILSNLEAFLR